MFVEACLLRPSLHRFSMLKKPAERGPKPKQIGTSDYCRTCGCFVYLNSTGQSSRYRKAAENLSLRVFVKVLQDESWQTILRDLGFTVSHTEDQSSRFCLHFFLLKPAFKKESTTMIAFGF